LKRTAVLSLILVVAVQPVLMALFVTNVEALPGWTTETVDSAGWVGTFTSIALDSSNNPHISYSDASNSDLKYAKWTGTAWSIQTVDSALSSIGTSTSIALDSSNNPHISYSG